MSIRIDGSSLIAPQASFNAEDIKMKARSLIKSEADSVGIGPEAQARSVAQAPTGQLDETSARDALTKITSSMVQTEAPIGHTLDPDRVAQLINL